MNPHFIFNTLGSIQSFLLQDGKSKEAAYYLTKFGGLMRQILTQSQIDLIPLSEEIKTLENYLLLQKMRFEGKFDYTFDINPQLLKDEIQIPPMILQPIIENAIEHGKIYNQENGNIQISIDKNQRGALDITIHDNGIGIIKSQTHKLKSKKSVSMDIIRQRIDHLSKKFNQLSQIQLHSSPSGGTIVNLILPLINSPSHSNSSSL